MQEDGVRGARRGRSRQQALVSRERWLVSYADFMTLLFAFFVVLFAASRHSADGLGKLSGAIQSGFSGTGGQGVPIAASGVPAPRRPPAAILDLDSLALELHTVLGDSIRRHEVALEQTPEGLVISFEELGFFHSGEAGLVASQVATIVQAGSILRRHGLVLRVEGHSDDQPIHNAVFASNWELSAARAMTVLLLLVDQAHYDPTRLAMAGYGPYRPVADNATEQGRQKNRRVDLVVIRAQQDAVLQPTGSSAPSDVPLGKSQLLSKKP